MEGFEKNPRLGNIFERWGASVAQVAAKRRRRELCQARVSEMPYLCSQEVIDERRALDKRILADRDLPEPIESPPLVPEMPLSLSVDEQRTLKLIEEAERLAFDPEEAEQLPLL